MNTILIATGGGLRIYGPGEEVRGHILLQRTKAELIGNIVIKLWGGVRTEIQDSEEGRTVEHYGRQLLFVTERPVVEKSTALKEGEEYMWPFSIMFPTRLDLPATSMHPVDESLPPSYSIGALNSVSRIEYKLTVVVYRHGSAESLYEVDKLISFAPTLQPRAKVPEPHIVSDTRNYVAKSGKLLSEEESHAVNASQKWSLFHSKDKRTAAFNFTVSWPTQAVVGEKMQIYLGIEHLPAESTVPRAPEVRVMSCSIAFKAADRIETDDRVNEPDIKHTLTGWKHDWQDRGVFTEGDGWTKALITTSIPESLPPTFSIFRIKRTYSVVICATLMVANKKFEYKTSPGKGQFRLYPRRARNAVQFGDEAADSSTLQTYREDIEEGLPSYEAALKGP